MTFQWATKNCKHNRTEKYFWIEWNIELKSLWDGCNQFCECWHCFILMLAETPTLFEAIQCENYLFDNRLAFCNWSNWAESVSNDWKWKSDASDADIKKWNKKSYWKSESVRKKTSDMCKLKWFLHFRSENNWFEQILFIRMIGGFCVQSARKKVKMNETKSIPSNCFKRLNEMHFCLFTAIWRSIFGLKAKAFNREENLDNRMGIGKS